MSDSVVAARMAEAAQIESEWNAMSYKDRAAWWMSAKWYGYMSAEAYRRGDPLNTDISCRYGEPGFFIATRVPYFDAQAAVSTIVSTTTTTTTTTPADPEPAPAPAPEEPTVAASTDNSEPQTDSSTSTTATAVETAADEAANMIREATAAIVGGAGATVNKKKKKKHNKSATATATAAGAAGAAGKTIQIKLGGK